MKRREHYFLTVILIFIAAFMIFDVYLDRQEGATWNHVMVELLVVVACTLGLLVLMVGMLRRKNSRLSHIKMQNQKLVADVAFWQREAEAYIKGLSRVIDQQFDQWRLTQAEKEVALMLVKGFTLQEIADFRRVSPKTVRQQTVACYRKSGVAGRAELAAFFLEDLLLPTPCP